jgi:membrane protein implicated in regulation of membrane protease activity
MAQRIRTSEIRHRRDTWLWIILPMFLLVLLIAAAVAVLVIAPRELQAAHTSVVSDLMLSVLILCPAVLCMLPVTILMLTSVIGFSRVHGAAARPLRRLEGHSETLNSKANSVANRINRGTINISSRLGFIYRHLGTFEQKSDKGEPHG